MSKEVEMVCAEIFLIMDNDGDVYHEIFWHYCKAIAAISKAGFDTPIIIGTTIKVPITAFSPKLQLEIDIPAEAFEKKPIQAELNEVSIPIELNEKKTTAKVRETLEDGNGAGIIAFIRKIFKGE